MKLVKCVKSAFCNNCFMKKLRSSFNKDVDILMPAKMKPSVYHAVIIIFLEFFAWGLLTTPMMDVLKNIFIQWNHSRHKRIPFIFGGTNSWSFIRCNGKENISSVICVFYLWTNTFNGHKSLDVLCYDIIVWMFCCDIFYHFCLCS